MMCVRSVTSQGSSGTEHFANSWLSSFGAVR